MTKPIDPYSRVYWRVAEDPKFSAIYPDDRHLATWLRLLMLADAMYPTAAPIPATARAASVRALADCGLLERLPGGLYRIHGMKAERDRRWGPRVPQAEPDGNPTGTGADPDGSLVRAHSARQAKPSLDETSQAEPSLAGEDAVLDVYERLTGRVPEGKARTWLLDLSEKYDVAERVLAETYAADTNLRTLIGRTADALEAKQHKPRLVKPARDEAAISAEMRRLMEPGATA